MKIGLKRVVISLILLFLYAQISYACGGFFCSNVPMNQAAERILFVKRDDGKITTHVQIQYSGEKTDFAWILPVPSIPDLGVSHNGIFQQLQFATQPTFQLEWEDSDCPIVFPPIFRFDDAVAAASPEADSVQVIAEERVGPYDTAIITSTDPAAIINWLVENGYQLGSLGADLLQPYTDGGFFFLALRLAPDRDVGDLQPIALTYDANMPGIPIKLTAVAAEANMGVLVWVLGQNRAIPENYLHVEINEASIDWLSGGGNYDQVVTEAANEAGGQAFASEYAGQSAIMKDRIYRQGQYDNLELLTSRTDPISFLEGLLILGFPRDSQIQTLIRRHIPIPQRVWDEGVLQVIYRGNTEEYERARADSASFVANVERRFYNSLESFSEYITDISFDPAAFVRDLQAVIVDPLKNAQELFEQHPYLTRLYTTLSAEEMTVDPMFAFNADLPDLSNIHQARAKYICPDGPDTKPEN
ncbi:MAG: DUF2330 domain-containing protein, partial [Candidatus Latescibacteria bacterium]|nr:DUF2330 domain-containing protein [Candidatus Latescibacterota bacterium]